MEIISVLVIVPGAYTQESQNVQKLTHVPLAIAILLVVLVVILVSVENNTCS